MRKASLFSGIGGIDLAAHWAGMETVLFCERELFCQRVLRKHWPDVPIIDDVREVTREELEKRGVLGNGRTIDLISAGYPCQPFSYAGKRRGAEDDRHLWPEVKRILEEIRPRWFVGENVAGHVTLGLDDVLADLENIGYTTQAFVIPACAVYASHRRDRVFIVAHSGGGKRQSRPEVKGILRGMQENGTIGNYAGGRSEAQSRGVVAYTTGDGLPRRGRTGFETKSAETRTGADDRPERCGEILAHAHGERRKECYTSASDEGTGQHPWGADARWVYSARGTAEPGVGRGADELSAEMDGRGLNPLDALKGFIDAYPQPALMGQPQHEWEPPRVATGVKNRAARLKALGNAVDPLQIFPIMYAIKLIDDWLREGKA